MAPTLNPALLADARLSFKVPDDRYKADFPDFLKHLTTVGLDKFKEELMQSPLGDVIAHALHFSPYLRRLLHSEAAFIAQNQNQSAVQTCLDAISTLENVEKDQLKSAMRHVKQRVALISALCDIGGIWSLKDITGILSILAEVASQTAVEHIWQDFKEKGDVSGDVKGYCVLALGKLGGHELNYSSDIDLICLFDADNFPYTGRETASHCAVKMTRKLVEYLQERTPDGYVFRVDLRLRPDPGATPIAVSFNGAETYYQSLAQTWERSAFIKARPIAGDLEAGHDFLERLRPFIWRRHLDFAAIDDIHAMKSRIHEHHFHQDLCLAGHDVKLGIGGIREIEFYAQTYQLISGGRRIELQTRPTLDVLNALHSAGDITASTHEDLCRAYSFYRQVEHRLQMIDDQQTHLVPDDPQRLQDFANFLGFSDAEALETHYVQHLKRVHHHYEDLLPDSDKPLRQLQDQLEKFRDQGRVQETIKVWHSGRYRCLRASRSQALLNTLLPEILHALSQAPDPDQTLIRFDQFLAQLPSGVQLLSLFNANPKLLDLIAHIMGRAPALADQLARRPSLIEGPLNAGFFDPLPSADELSQDLQYFLKLSRSYEETLDRARIWANERRFQIGVLMLEGLLSPVDAGKDLSKLADVLIHRLSRAVMQDFRQSAGDIEAGAFLVLALGGYGAQALTYTSDLDLVFLYDCPKGAISTGGRRDLSPQHYYGRFAQRLISALTILTGEGRLFEIDMRLRPSGRAGIIAVSLESFAQYQDEDAWSWEHMSLTKARIITGEEKPAAQAARIIDAVRAKKHDMASLRADIQDMRRRYDQEFPDTGLWQLNTAHGGLADINWLLHFHILQLPSSQHLHSDFDSQLHAVNAVGALDAGECDTLKDAWTLLFNARSLARLLLGETKKITKADPTIQQTLANLLHHANFQESCKQIESAKAHVRELFSKYIGYPNSKSGA